MLIRTAQSFQITLFVISLIVMLPLVTSSGSAIDLTIEFINSTALAKCGGCENLYRKQNANIFEKLDASGAEDYLQVPSANLFNDISLPVEFQLAQNTTISRNEITIASAEKTNISEMRVVFLKLMKNPTNIELNSLYANLAEQNGKLNKALVTYERLVLLEPNNIKWENQVKRLRELSQPPETTIAAVYGVRFDRNGPLNADNIGNRAGYNTSLVLTLDHKRTIGRHKYQATGQYFTDYNITAPASDLYLGAFQIGPLFKTLDNWQIRPALLLERSLLNRHEHNSLSQSMGTVFNFVNLKKSPIKTIDVSLYYVDFYDESPGKDAFVWTGTSGIETQGFGKDSTLILSPSITYNKAQSGIGSDGFRDQYYEVEINLAYSRELTENFELGPTISYRYREFMDYKPGGNVPRNDRNYILGFETSLTEWIPGVIILGAYTWERNKSLLEGNTYTNHSIAMNFIKLF